MTIEANSNIILQMHYPAGSIGQVDSTAIHLFFYDDNLKILEKCLLKDYWKIGTCLFQQIIFHHLTPLIRLEIIF